MYREPVSENIKNKNRHYPEIGIRLRGVGGMSWSVYIIFTRSGINQFYNVNHTPAKPFQKEQWW